VSTPDIKSKRFTLVEREEYTIDLEYGGPFAILHLPRVGKFTKTVYLDAVNSIENIEEFVKDFGFDTLWAALDPNNNSLIKLIKKMGFEYQGSAEGMDVYRRIK
jgi:hypothetical protein